MSGMKTQICFILRKGEIVKKKEKKIVTDPFGSYTGRGQDPFEKPIQDADDL